MFGRKERKEQLEELEAKIKFLKTKLDTIDPTKPEYETVCANLDHLYAMREKYCLPWHARAESLNAIVPGLIGLAGTVLVINSEHVGNITSKAFNSVFSSLFKNNRRA